MFRILDLDNCISDDGWRIPRIDWQHADLNRRYFNYHLLAPFDHLGNGQLLATPHDLIIFTARPVSFRAATVEWLARNCIRHSVLLMRNDHEHAPSGELKERQLKELLDYHPVTLNQIADAYDDREDVIEMYKRFGVRAEVAKIHDICAYTPRVGASAARDLARGIAVGEAASAACGAGIRK